MLLFMGCWVAVQELQLNFHIRYIYIYVRINSYGFPHIVTYINPGWSISTSSVAWPPVKDGGAIIGAIRTDFPVSQIDLEGRVGLASILITHKKHNNPKYPFYIILLTCFDRSYPSPPSNSQNFQTTHLNPQPCT